MASLHKIKRQTIELSFRAGLNERALQERLRQLCYSHFLPETGRTCDTLSPNGVLHRIERLELDLGQVRLERLELDMAEQFQRNFRPALERAIQQAEINTSRNDSHNPGQCVRTAAGSAWELLHVFAQTGLLPWWADSRDTEALEKAAEQMADAKHTGLSETLSRLLEQPAPRSRLWGNLSMEAILHLLQIIAKPETKKPPVWDFIRSWFHSLPSWSHRLEKPAGELRYDCLEALFFALPKELAPAALWKLFILAIRPPDSKIKEWEVILNQFANENATKTFGKVINQAWAQGKKNLSSPEKAPAGIKKGHPLRRKTGEDTTAATSTRPDRLRRETVLKASEGLTVYNAGMVLLAPFLPRFFEYLEWTVDKRFANKKKQTRGVFLLQYLASGATNAPEYQLPLNKILAGLPIDAILDLQEPLTEAEQTAGTELLEATLSHATCLGLVSADGLRGSFLMREGILRHKKKNWNLHLKQEPFDILLKGLPWSFQIVRLPWMPEPLFVEW